MSKEVKRKVISLETKIEILDRLRKGDRVVDVAKSYNMNEATIRTIRTNENFYFYFCVHVKILKKITTVK